MLTDLTRPMYTDLTRPIIYRLLLAAVLGGIVGLEREIRRKPAGLRTNMFICMGSALFTLLSEEIAERFGDASSTRIVSNLIPGIGFIGAGAIIRERGSVVGLTTAATIFMVASIGMAVGAGLIVTAIFTTLVILAALVVLGWAEDRFSLKTRLMTFRLTTAQMEPVMAGAHQVLTEMKVGMQHFQVFRVGAEYVMEFDADVSYSQERQLFGKLSALDARCEVVPLGTERE
jgi:putative Mg2+ transporter-C (MgtC) family protein